MIIEGFISHAMLRAGSVRGSEYKRFTAVASPRKRLGCSGRADFNQKAALAQYVYRGITRGKGQS